MSLAQKVTGTGISGATAAGSAMAVVPAPYDSVQTSNTVAPANSTLTFNATPGKRWIIEYLSADFYGIGAVPPAAFVAVVIIDGATIIYQHSIYIPAAAAAAQLLEGFILTGVAIPGTIGNAVIVRFQIPGPLNTGQELSAGAYLV